MTSLSKFSKYAASIGLLLSTVLVASVSSAEAFGPFNYRCFDLATAPGCTVSQESPFANSSFAYFYLEDFEDRAFNVPGVTAAQGGILADFGPFQDSVDEDDGTVDGVNAGDNATFGLVSGAVTVTFNFDAAGLGGRLPTHVGLALVNNFNGFVFRAFNAAGDEVETVSGSTNFVANGSALDDNFTGASHLPGIASVSISGSGGGMEVDHLQYGFVCDTSAAADEDGDGVPDASDNCLFSANPNQRDTDGDGFGNLCDADLNNDGTTNIIDLGLLRTVFFTSNADADFNGDGIVNVLDLGLFRQRFFQAPGPACSVPQGR